VALPGPVKHLTTQHSKTQQHLGKEGLRRCISTGLDERQEWRLVAEGGQVSSQRHVQRTT
jgi:hypothetical protein